MNERRQPTREELAVCAHDLRGTLTVIAGYAALLRRDDLSDRHRLEALAGIEEAVARADALLSDALAGRIAARTTGEPVALAALAHRAAADARAAYGRDVHESILTEPIVPGDALAIARALENLLANAAKYAPEGPIDVVVRTEGEHAVLEVADRGPGIPAEMREAVLEPFARLERDDEKPGSGLGLTVVRSVAERHMGRAEVLAREGGGTVVRLELPLG